MSIFTPRSCIKRILDDPDNGNPQTCTKIMYKGYEISISMDSGHCDGDLTRTDLRVYGGLDFKDNLTEQVLFELTEKYGYDVEGTAENLILAFANIDKLCAK